MQYIKWSLYLDQILCYNPFMRIVYHPNPLRTQFFLDPTEEQILWFKIKITEMDNLLFEADFRLHEQYFDLDAARKAVDSSYYQSDDDNEPSKLDQRVSQLCSLAIQELRSDHFGDCTAVACSCGKCYAEQLLGVDSIPKASKSILSAIRGAFKTNETTLDEALTCLSTWHLDLSPEEIQTWNDHGGYEQYIEGWKKQRKAAYEWLRRYQEEHFP